MEGRVPRTAARRACRTDNGRGQGGSGLSATSSWTDRHLAAISSQAAPIARNIHGDAAWPPVRPPSSGQAEAEARFQTDQGTAAFAALEAWRTPSQPVPDDVEADSNAEMMLMVSCPSTTQVPLSSIPPPPLNRSQPLNFPSSIKMELLKDPEAEVRGLRCESALPPDRAATLYYTNSEANKQGALTE